MLTPVAALRAHSNNYKQDFDAVTTYFFHCFGKKGLITSFKVTYIAQARSAKKQKTSKATDAFKERIELKNFFFQEYHLHLWYRNRICQSSATKLAQPGVREKLMVRIMVKTKEKRKADPSRNESLFL